MKITVAGTGYVGLSLAVLMAQSQEVVALDINADKVNLINSRISPIKDDYISEYLQNRKLNLHATTDKNDAYLGANYVIIATPTNYDDLTNNFDTSSIESVIEDVLKITPNTPIIIKSTIPVGYTERMRLKYNKKNIIFSPEFLREGKALYDNLFPSRIIIGDTNEEATVFANLLKTNSLKDDVEILLMNSTEAEAVKLFSNSYLALRISFFNELDTYAEIKGLNTKSIIEGVSLDPRIGNHYNNPSFGYGGYCLPKDTKQLLANYKDVPQNVIGAIVKSNSTRKNHITNEILSREPNTVGIYRLTMKKDSDNFRQSAVQSIIEGLSEQGVNIVIFEPSLDTKNFNGFLVLNDLTDFKKKSDIIIANRVTDVLDDVSEKVYTRDVFTRD